VDVVIASQIAHHLSPDDIVRLASRASRVARIGVIVADLRRSELAVLAFRLGSRLLGFDPATRADGVTSVRCGFHRNELAVLLRAGGIAAVVTERPIARLVAFWKP
jgi:hypothetical protein